MLNAGKQWISFDKWTWRLVVYCLIAIGFALGLTLQLSYPILTGD